MEFDSVPLKLNSAGQYVLKTLVEKYKKEIKAKNVILSLVGLYSEVEHKKDPFIGLKMSKIVADELITAYNVSKHLIWIGSGNVIHGKARYFGVDCIGKSNIYKSPTSFRIFSFAPQSISFSEDVIREMTGLDSIYRSQCKLNECRFIFSGNALTEELQKDTHISLKRCKLLIDTLVKNYQIPRFLFAIVDTPQTGDNTGGIRWAIINKKD